MNKPNYSKLITASVIVVLIVAPLGLAGFGLFKITEPIRTSALRQERVLLKLESQLDSANRPTSLTRTLTYGSWVTGSASRLKQALDALAGNPFPSAPATLRIALCPRPPAPRRRLPPRRSDPQHRPRRSLQGAVSPAHSFDRLHRSSARVCRGPHIAARPAANVHQQTARPRNHRQWTCDTDRAPPDDAVERDRTATWSFGTRMTSPCSPAATQSLVPPGESVGVVGEIVLAQKTGIPTFEETEALISVGFRRAARPATESGLA